MRVLTAITSHGTGNDVYLKQVVEEYRSMADDVDVVVLSNVEKSVPAGTELVVGVPTDDPWSLPFAHKRIFMDRVDNYDLFVYSEDDILITSENISAFVEASEVLPSDECAGFLRIEVDRDGRTYYPDAHQLYHWDPNSVQERSGRVYAFFTCEHAACYMLTRAQLKRAIASGGFAVPPHQGKYDLACSASTDPYTQCGLKKVICISDLVRFHVRHLSNRYIGTTYDLEESDFRKQIEALFEIVQGKRTAWELLGPETAATRTWYKDYYEPARHELLGLVPDGAESVLSIGCGWGALEAAMTQAGMSVAAIPLDSVISACAEARGVRVVSGDLRAAWQEFTRERFDCILILNLLHLLPNPLAVLKACTRMLSDSGCILLSVPNFKYLKAVWRGFGGASGYTMRGEYGQTGVHKTGYVVVEKWLHSCGLVSNCVVNVVPNRAKLPQRFFSGLTAQYLTKEVIVRAHKRGAPHPVPADTRWL